MNTRICHSLAVSAFLLLAVALSSLHAATYYVGGNNPGSNWWPGTWDNLQTALHTAVSGDVVKVSGDLLRTAGDTTTGDLEITNRWITLSGGWDADFTGQAWKGQTKLSDELPLYSVLDVNGSNTADNRFRVLLISGARNVTIEGFRITKGYAANDNGGGIAVESQGVRLGHLYVTQNTGTRDYGGCGGIYLNAPDAVLEYLTVTQNHSSRYNGYAAVYGGAIRVESGALNGDVLLANCMVEANTLSDSSSYGSAIEFKGPCNPSSIVHWTVFGSVVRANANTANAVVGLLGRGNGRANLVNSVVVDNNGKVRVSQEGGGGNNEQDNYIINSILADTIGCQAQDASSQIKFRNTLIDPESPAVGGSYFDGTKYLNLGGSVANTQPLFADQAGDKLTLQKSSPAFQTGAALYSSTGGGFAYVDVDRDGGYDAGVDIIVDIMGSYTPSSNEYYYPKDMLGVDWIMGHYGAGTPPKIHMGAFSTPPSGLVVCFR